MRIAVIQMNSEPDVDKNLAKIKSYIAGSAESGADLVVFPEAAMFPSMRTSGHRRPAADGPRRRRGAGRLGRRHRRRRHVHPADTVFRTPPGVADRAGEGKGKPTVQACLHTLLVTGPNGTEHYHKIHTLDAFGYRESDTVKPGTRRVTYDVGGVTIGLATCYDIRFPGHFYALAEAGATVMVVPTAWTDGPGKLDQWRTLTAARALDTTSFVVAAGQARPGSPERYGQNDGPTGIGHSAIISPGGARLAETGYVAQTLVVDIDPNQVEKVRKGLPVLKGHRRDLKLGKRGE